MRATPGATPERLTNAQMDSLAPLVDNGRLSSDGRRKVVSSGGDLYLIDMTAGMSRRLTQTLTSSPTPRSAPTGERSFLSVRTTSIRSPSTAA